MTCQKKKAGNRSAEYAQVLFRRYEYPLVRQNTLTATKLGNMLGNMTSGIHGYLFNSTKTYSVLLWKASVDR